MNKQSEACRYEHVYQAIDDIRGTAEVLKKYFNVPTKEARIMATKTVCRSAGLDEKPLLKLCGEEKPYTNHGHSDYQIVWNDGVFDALGKQ